MYLLWTEEAVELMTSTCCRSFEEELEPNWQIAFLLVPVLVKSALCNSPLVRLYMGAEVKIKLIPLCPSHVVNPSVSLCSWKYNTSRENGAKGFTAVCRHSFHIPDGDRCWWNMQEKGSFWLFSRKQMWKTRNLMYVVWRSERFNII